MKNKRLILFISSLTLAISLIFAIGITSSAASESTDAGGAVTTPYGSFTPTEEQTPEAYPIAVFNPDRTLRGLYTNWKSALDSAVCVNNSVVYFRADVNRPTDEKFTETLKGQHISITVDLNGKTLTKTENLLFSNYLKGGSTNTHVTFKNGYMVQAKNASWRAFINYDFSKTEHTDTSAVMNYTFENVVFKDNRAYSSKNFFLFTISDSDASVSQVHGTIIYKNCEFYSNGCPLFDATGANDFGHFNLTIRVNGGKVSDSSGIAFNKLARLSTLGDEVTFGSYNGAYTEFVSPASLAPGTEIFLKDDSSRELLLTPKSSSAESIVYELIPREGGEGVELTPYTAIVGLTEEKSDKSIYPLAVFHGTGNYYSFVDVYTDWRSAVEKARATNGSVVYFRDNVDRPMGEAGVDLDGIKGKITIDLNGKTLTKADKLIFDIYLRNTTTKVTVVFKNGTMAHKECEKDNWRAFIQYNHGNAHTASDAFINFEFDNVKFKDNRVKLGTNPNFIIVANGVPSGYKKIYGDILFNECEFYNNNALTLFRGYDTNSRIDLSFTVKGGKIISGKSITENTIFYGSSHGDSIVFAKGENGNYLKAELSGGATVDGSVWKSIGGLNIVFEKTAESKNSTTYTLTSPSADSYVPKMNVTLDSNFIVNVFVPVNRTQKFTFNGQIYENEDSLEAMKVTIGGEEFYKVSATLASAEAAENLLLISSVELDEGMATARFTFSIPKYASKIISSEATDKEEKLIKDALAYIASAYTYFAKNNAEEVNASIKAIIKNHAITYSISAKDAAESPYIKGATFTLASTPAIRFYLADGYSDSQYSFFANGRVVNDISYGSDSNGRFAEVSLYAYKMCGAVSYAVDGEIAGSYRITNYYSYISKNAFTSDKKEELRDMVRKFYNYSMAAADYFLSNTREDLPESVDLSDFEVVYIDGAEEQVIKKAEKLAKALSNALGKKMSASSELNSTASKKIIVGNSTRISEATAIRLSQNDSEDAFLMEFREDRISLFGKTEDSTLRAIEYFIDNYVDGENREGSVISLYDGAEVIKQYMNLGGGVEIVVETESTVLSVVPGVYNGGLYPSKLSKAYYPSVVELKHNGENNGKLIAILAVIDTPTADYLDLDTNGCVMESSDGGKTWKMIARPMETIDTTIQGITMAHIYELPTQVGDMPAGTLLYSGNAVNYDSHSHIGVWRSFDCGYTWEEYTIVDAAGGSREGVWEPFIIYEESDGYLYCFYSDDSDPAHSQKLVYKRTKDGVNWSAATEVCAFKKTADRPGMIVMTELGNGKYFIVYEYYGSYSGNVFYKTSDDISVWDEADIGTMLSDGGYTVGGGPACIWTPAGGENGTLIVSGKHDTDGGQQHLLFVSFDYGNSWTTMENPLAYDITLDSKDTNRVGHSPSFIVSSDPSLIYYLNTTVVPETGYQRVQFASMRIYSTTEEKGEQNSPSSFTAEQYTTNEGKSIKYWLYTPENATANMPMIVYLHGGSGKGDDLELITSVDGFPSYLKSGLITPDCYVIIPQVSSDYKGWGDMKSNLINLITFISGELQINENKISLTGHSMGGSGTWQIALGAPDLFSAIAPLSGSVKLSNDNLSKLSNLSVWAFVGTADTVVEPQSSIDFIASLDDINADAKITVLEGVDHFTVPSAVYLSDEFNLINWLISQNK